MDLKALVVFFFFFLSILLLIMMFNRLKSVALKLPPSPYAWPIFGNMFNLDIKKPHISLSNLAKSLGPLFSLRFGSQIVVVASTPEAAREVYKIHDKELSGRFCLQICDKIPGMKNSVIAMANECDENWRSMRSMSHNQLFSAQALESHSHSRVEKVKEMLKHLSSKEGEVVKIADIFFATMVNSLSTATTSQDIIRDWDNIGEAKLHMKKLLMLATPSIGDLYPRLGGLDFVSKKKIKDYLDFAKGLWGDILVERKLQEKNGDKERSPDFLDSLIKNSRDYVQIISQLLEFFASVETMTTTIEWAIAELTRNPEALYRLREELDEAIGRANNVTEHDITMLPFLQACVKETFRLHTPIPFLVPRVALQTCKVMNYDIPKGSLIITNAYAMGRDPKNWEDPVSFKPERFLGKNLDVKGTNYELLPFGGGRRICAGHLLALKLIHLLVASLVYSFDWSVPGEIDQTNIDMGEVLNVVNLQKEKPMLLILKKRKDLKIE